MDRVEALAEALASMEGNLDAFRRERDADPPMSCDDPAYYGHYLGYVSDAGELIRRLGERGYTVVPGG